MSTAPAYAKVNLALVVGPVRPDGKHEVVTVLQRVGLADEVSVEPAPETVVSGFTDDTLGRAALDRLAAAAGHTGGWALRIEKSIPVAAGLGGGSSDAATALKLANRTLAEPLTVDELAAIARSLGADVPFFLFDGPQLGTGDGSSLTPLDVPQEYVVLLVLLEGATKTSTATVYRAFDERGGATGFDERRRALVDRLARLGGVTDLAALPPNDLVSSPLVDDLTELGAFRADVSGAGPVVYGLFLERAAAVAAGREVGHVGKTWITRPV